MARGSRHTLTITQKTRTRIPRALLERVHREALRRYGPPHSTETSLVVVGSAEIARINKERRGKPKPTDVLSFALTREVGEIFIAPSHIVGRNNAEIGLTYLHGLLHVLGFDHEQGPGAERRMAQAENAIVKAVPALARASGGVGLLRR